MCPSVVVARPGARACTRLHSVASGVRGLLLLAAVGRRGLRPLRRSVEQPESPLGVLFVRGNGLRVRFGRLGLLRWIRGRWWLRRLERLRRLHGSLCLPSLFPERPGAARARVPSACYPICRPWRLLCGADPRAADVANPAVCVRRAVEPRHARTWRVVHAPAPRWSPGRCAHVFAHTPHSVPGACCHVRHGRLRAHAQGAVSLW